MRKLRVYNVNDLYIAAESQEEAEHYLYEVTGESVEYIDPVNMNEIAPGGDMTWREIIDDMCFSGEGFPTEITVEGE